MMSKYSGRESCYIPGRDRHSQRQAPGGHVGSGDPWDRGRSWRHLAFLIGHWQLGGTGMWALEHRETGAFVGLAGFSEPAGWPGCELAWTLARRWWGHGYATEAARAALDHAFQVWWKERAISLIHPENQASIRVAERLGETLRDRIASPMGERLCFCVDRESRVPQSRRGRGTRMRALGQAERRWPPGATKREGGLCG